MKKILLLLLISTTIVSCNNNDSDADPIPAISFQESIKDLKKLEKNQLCDVDYDFGDIGSFGHNAEMQSLKYITNIGDSLEYQFMKGKLAYVLIKLAKTKSKSTIAKYMAISKHLNGDNLYTQVADNIFLKGDVIIRLGVEKNDVQSVLYLNNEDKEVTTCLKAECIQDLNKSTEGKSNDVFAWAAMSYIAGSSTGVWKYYSALWN